MWQADHGSLICRHADPWHAGLERVLMFGGKIYECDELLPLGDMWDGERVSF